ncbi:hypothetical protein MRX96_007509 [Rhipicephalus microplus]
MKSTWEAAYIIHVFLADLPSLSSFESTQPACMQRVRATGRNTRLTSTGHTAGSGGGRRFGHTRGSRDTGNEETRAQVTHATAQPMAMMPEHWESTRWHVGRQKIATILVSCLKHSAYESETRISGFQEPHGFATRALPQRREADEGLRARSTADLHHAPRFVNKQKEEPACEGSQPSAVKEGNRTAAWFIASACLHSLTVRRHLRTTPTKVLIDRGMHLWTKLGCLM